jgi:hypothetical protein
MRSKLAAAAKGVDSRADDAGFRRRVRRKSRRQVFERGERRGHAWAVRRVRAQRAQRCISKGALCACERPVHAHARHRRGSEQHNGEQHERLHIRRRGLRVDLTRQRCSSPWKVARRRWRVRASPPS